uniref:Uncharacterized protein n=1 Tax=Erpetoichthys calabaricus TaxID=27687 RepID=A0A8C4RN36_ERPCA
TRQSKSEGSSREASALTTALLCNTALTPLSNPLQAIFYGKIDKKNPVILSLDTEIKELKGYMKKVRSQEGRFRGARSLFNIFNKYKPRLPPMYFEEKLLEFGDFLYKLQMYDLALWQSYERYLQKFGSFNLDEITDVNSFRSVFFPEGLGVETAALTFHALQGSSICTYHLLKESDSILQNEQSINKVISILTFLRVTTEALLPIEKLCWLLYNGSSKFVSSCLFLLQSHKANLL